MSTPSSDDSYVIHSDSEPLRLDRQARIYGIEDDLRHARLAPADTVLDAGCGSGSAARLFASHFPGCNVVGVDRSESYLSYAQRAAQREGISNVVFRQADVLSLPFADGTFDVVWSKHLLQWVADRESALIEFRRVTRPGGRVVCCNFDGFCLSHYPTDPDVQRDVERWFGAAQAEFGFDNNVGRKLPTLFQQAGLIDVRCDIIPDKAFCGFGGDPERRWNWETQWNSARAFTTKVFGSETAAEEVTARILRTFNDPGVFVYTALFYVEGIVPR
jgi:SAM-dependent methyltransferase